MILNGECGAFNPDILDCFSLVVGDLEDRISLYNGNFRGLFNTHYLSKEAMQRKEILVSNRSFNLFEEERSKYMSFASLANEILFEYDIQNKTLSLSENNAKNMNLPIKIPNITNWLLDNHIINKHDLRDFLNKIKTITIDSPITKHQCLIHLKNQQPKWSELIVQALWTNDDKKEVFGYIGKIIDISEQKNEEMKLKQLADLDPLTNLFNYKSIREKINSKLNNSSCSLIFFMDLDNFKLVNDTLGHIQGDCVLKKIGMTISESLSHEDLAARIGGDEFLVYLHNVDKRKLVERVSEFWNHLQHSLSLDNLSMSMGISIYPENDSDLENLIHKADMALYESKNTGKSKYSFSKNDNFFIKS